jgi:hypothetical protein
MNLSNALICFVFMTSVLCATDFVESLGPKPSRQFSDAIISNFLQQAKKKIGTKSLSQEDLNNQIFDLKCNLHSVEMTIKREDSGQSPVVMIVTTVDGTVADFEGKHIAEVDKNLLKYKLIQGYLMRFAEAQAAKTCLTPLDDNTKIVRLPDAMVETLHYGFMEQRRDSKEYKAMSLLTVLRDDEFNELVKNCFPVTKDSEAVQEAQKHDTRMGFTQGVGVGALVTALVAFALKNS